MPKKTNENQWFGMRVNVASNHADVYIFGVIGWEVTPIALVTQLKENPDLRTLTVHINSLGGFIGDGLAILNTLRSHKATITTIIEGYALSMGSIIAQAGDRRLMADNTLMMIHRAQGGAFGDAADLAKEAEVLKKHEQVLINEYVRVMGISVDEVQNMLNEETWFTAEEALSAGLVDEITSAVDLDESSNQISQHHWQAASDASYQHAPPGFTQQLKLNLSNRGVPMAKANKQPAKAGASLASLLNARIDELETDDTPRSQIIEDMASEAGISAGTVNSILDQTINCPPLERLQGFSSALDISESSIVSAAENDGCVYGDEGENIACPNTNLNSGDNNMGTKTDPKLDAEVIARQAVAAENKRQTDIRSAFSNTAAYSVDESGKMLESCLADIDCDKAKANAMILDAMGKQAPKAMGTHAIVMENEKDKFKTGVTMALSSRAGTLSKAEKDKDFSNNFRGYTLLELARAALKMNGVSTGGLSKMELVGNAFTHTSGDFSSLLANVAEKSMLKGYDEAEETFQLWTARGEASDFKPISRVDLNSFPSLSKVIEGAEYTYGTVGDRGETIQLASYGKLFSISRQAIINDDLSAFTRIPQRMGRAAIRTVGDLVYAILTSNPNMSDGVALFHATHNNLLTAAGINTASVDAMRVAMGTQTDDSKNAHALNIRMANVIVPMALGGTANVVANSEFEVGASNKNNTIPNSVRGTFDVISDARLDADSASSWYGTANSGSHDTIEVSYLDGQDAPFLESKDGWNVDGAEFKVRIDAAVSPLDFRTLAKNPGV